MHKSEPDRLLDELDALLDGRPVELTDELAPLVEAADALRVELAAHQLEPEVADRHLERVLGSSANVVPMPTRPQPSGWDVRRRIVAVALAAALVLAPATMASAAALPGQAMYPFKLAIEQLRLASVQWSPGREAGERTRVAHERLSEVQSLLNLEMYNQLPTAIRALDRAVEAAQLAVQEAQDEGEPVSSVALRLSLVKQVGGQVLQKVVDTVAKGPASGLTSDTAEEIKAAVQQSPTVTPPTTTAPKGGTGNPTQPTSPPPAGQGPGTSTSTPPPPSQSTATTTTPETSTSQATTTTAPPPTTTTAPPPTSTEPEASVTVGSVGGADKDKDKNKAGASGNAPQGYAPPTTAPPTSVP